MVQQKEYIVIAIVVIADKQKLELAIKINSDPSRLFVDQAT